MGNAITIAGWFLIMQRSQSLRSSHVTLYAIGSDMKVFTFVSIGTVLMAAVGSSFFYFRESEADQLAKQCVEAVIYRLDMPSTFKLSEVSVMERKPATATSLFGADDPGKAVYVMSLSPETRALQAAFDPANYEILSMYVVYDAEYTPGKVTHGASYCSVRVSKGAKFGEERLVQSDVMLNGFTKMEWLEYELSQ
jgi:hypothetical protein